MVIVPALASPLNDAERPAGRPVAVPIPVAPVVDIVIDGERATLIHVVTGAGVLAVLISVTVIEPVAFTVPQPPVNGIV